MPPRGKGLPARAKPVPGPKAKVVKKPPTGKPRTARSDGHGRDAAVLGAGKGPEAGQADFAFLMEQAADCMTKDTRFAVQQRVAIEGHLQKGEDLPLLPQGVTLKLPSSPFSGVGRKKRAGGTLWSASVSAKAIAINLGNFRDELVAARAHDLAALLFCESSSYRKLNFQEWTYEEELAQLRHMSQDEALMRIKARQNEVFDRNVCWCSQGLRSSVPRSTNPLPCSSAPGAGMSTPNMPRELVNQTEPLTAPSLDTSLLVSAGSLAGPIAQISPQRPQDRSRLDETLTTSDLISLLVHRPALLQGAARGSGQGEGGARRSPGTSLRGAKSLLMGSGMTGSGASGGAISADSTNTDSNVMALMTMLGLAKPSCSSGGGSAGCGDAAAADDLASALLATPSAQRTNSAQLLRSLADMLEEPSRHATAAVQHNGRPSSLFGAASLAALGPSTPQPARLSSDLTSLPLGSGRTTPSACMGMHAGAMHSSELLSKPSTELLLSGFAPCPTGSGPSASFFNALSELSGASLHGARSTESQLLASVLQQRQATLPKASQVGDAGAAGSAQQQQQQQQRSGAAGSPDRGRTSPSMHEPGCIETESG